MGLVQQADPASSDWYPGILGRNVEEVCRFPELPARKPLTYQAKQLIAREIEMEKMRRGEALAWAGGGPQVSLAPGIGTAYNINGLALARWLSSCFPSGGPGSLRACESADGQRGKGSKAACPT